jgi:hypothetical protein
MAGLNMNYDQIGQAFVLQYYGMFDNPTTRANLVNFYTPQASLMTFEGAQFHGAEKIMEKLKTLTFQKIAHIPTKVDCQPMFDGGILVMVIGQLKTDDDPPHPYTQMFVLKPAESSFYVAHDVFRLNLV